MGLSWIRTKNIHTRLQIPQPVQRSLSIYTGVSILLPHFSFAGNHEAFSMKKLVV